MAGKKPLPRKELKRTAQSAEVAFQTLRKAILTGEFKEGDKVREIRLVREWGVGRTPLREAIRRAAEAGYLVLRPNHAPVVRKLSAEDILQIYSVREVLECFALESAWGRFSAADLKELERLESAARKAKDPERRLHAQFAFDNALHRFWSEKSGNAWLVSILDRLFIFRPNYQSREINVMTERPNVIEAAFVDHQKILEALQKGDLVSARKALRRHIRHAGVVLAGLHK